MTYPLTSYTYVTTDSNGDGERARDLQASGIGEAGSLAYRLAEDQDRYCIAVYETEYRETVKAVRA